MHNFKPEFILNADQTPFNKEFSTKNTLDFKGERDITVIVQNLNAISHTYTVMPTISMAGLLFGKLFITFQEISDNFGITIEPKVRDLEKKLSNIRVFCTTSGKMTKRVCNLWAKEFIDSEYVTKFSDNSSKPKILLCLDSYSCHWNQEIDNEFDKCIELTKLKIPPKTTPFLQPLDCNFNQEIKYFMRKYTDFIIEHKLDICVYDRFVIMKILSQIWEQLSSTKFIPMIKYCFTKTFSNISDFQSARKSCFTSIDNNCNFENCQDNFFISCSICDLSLCFTHFFIDYHRHL